jgi:hypothetical protein
MTQELHSSQLPAEIMSEIWKSAARNAIADTKQYFHDHVFAICGTRRFQYSTVIHPRTFCHPLLDYLLVSKNTTIEIMRHLPKTNDTSYVNHCPIAQYCHCLGLRKIRSLNPGNLCENLISPYGKGYCRVRTLDDRIYNGAHRLRITLTPPPEDVSEDEADSDEEWY